MSKVVPVREASFDAEVLRSDIPVVVDFWAPWCGPCRMMAPVLEAASERWAGRVKFAKLDTDENGSTASRHAIMAIPTLIVFEKGTEKDRAVGFVPAAQLDDWLKRFAAPLPG
ncbi:MAG: thioredoxin [Candidatus Aminicenantes bacterium]|nr:thioredoxin [Candidatus Aminicenantes bacterium]